MGEMNKIEEVARAIWKRRVEFAASEGINLSDDDVGRMIIENGVLEEAKAAIEELRAATPKMVLAGRGAMSDGIVFAAAPGEGIEDLDARPAWSAMLDAALKE